jgi:hypothetical protein
LADKVFIDESGITVTEEQLLVSGLSFKISDIDGVGIRGKRPSRLAPILVGMIGLAVWLSTTQLYTYLGLAIVAAAWIWIRRLKTQYRIVLDINDNETTALESIDERLVQRVVQALNDAMHVPN